MKPDRKERRKAALKKWKAMTSEERVAFNRQLAEDIHSDCAAWNDCMDEHMSGIMAHYANARKKHPYFCDRITCLSSTGSDTRLDIYRSTLAAEIEASDVEACTVLECEVCEAMQAFTHGDTAHAIEELYDCIAVLLRTIDVLEGRQKLGKLETEGGEK